jgi:flagellin
MQMADVNLSKAVRSNLLSLQSTAANMAKTQNRLATGLKVNSALDNPSNFFTASALNSRAGDMANLMDSMASGIKTIEAADNGLKSITKTVESMQSTLRQARQDKSFKTASLTMGVGANPAGTEVISFSGGAVGTTAVTVDLTKEATTTAATAAIATGTADFADIDLSNNADNEFSFNINGDAITLTQASGGGDSIVDIDEAVTAIQTQMDALNAGAGNGVTVTKGTGANAARLVFTTDATGVAAEVEIDTVASTGTGATALPADLGFGTSTVTVNGADAVLDDVARTVDEMVTAINGTTALADKIRASNDNGKLRIENLSTKELTVAGTDTTTGQLTGGAGNTKIGGNDVRVNLEKQFNELRDQLDKFADDASFNGINLLRGDKLKLTFNETGTSTIEIQAKDKAGQATAINNTSLDIDTVVAGEFDSDTMIDSKLDGLKNALDSLRSQSSTFGSNLSVVENRQDFTKNMINTLETGAANLTLADTNEEAANLLALQTRQQLSSTALSMASQADQAVLRLF